MPIFHQIKTIFIHIPKTGGISIADMLADTNTMKACYNDDMNSRLSLLYGENPYHKEIGHPLENVSYLNHATADQLLKYCPVEFNSYFKFAIIRNPYDRICSYYYFCKMPEKLFDTTNVSFSDFCRGIVSGKYDILPQYKYIYDDQMKMMVDFVGRFENFDHDIQFLLDKFMIKRSIIKKNDSVHDHYSTYYTDETKEMIYQYFELDFKLFGYEK